ncbi:hypothetical protein EON81_19960 [bacterium]|nr:MAG: hypothetical protein EON81_19960 [bacterium]
MISEEARKTSTRVDETEEFAPEPSTFEIVERAPEEEESETPAEDLPEKAWGPIAPHEWWGTPAGRQTLRTLDTWGQTLYLRAITRDDTALPGPLTFNASGSDRGSPSDPNSSLMLFLDAERAIAKVTTRETRDFLYAVHGPGTEFRIDVARVRYLRPDPDAVAGQVGADLMWGGWEDPEWEETETRDGQTLKKPAGAVRAETMGGLSRIDRFRCSSYRAGEGIELIRAIGLPPEGVFGMAHRLAAKRIAKELGYL